MPRGDYEDMGPRIDLGAHPEEPGYSRQSDQGSSMSMGGGHLPPQRESSGGKGLTIFSLALALVAMLLAAWSLFSQPDPVTGPPLSPDVVPGGAAERVAKLEKDVSQLMLRLVTLEKELQSLANKAGTVSQLTELTSKVAALQDRLDALTVDQRMASLAKKRGQGSQPAKVKTPEPLAKPAVKAKPQPAKPSKKKLTYTVRRGDTLFTVAQRYKVRMSDLMKWNKMKKGDVLKIGDKLIIYR